MTEEPNQKVLSENNDKYKEILNTSEQKSVELQRSSCEPIDFKSIYNDQNIKELKKFKHKSVDVDAIMK